MSEIQDKSGAATQTSRARITSFKLGAIVIPVSDVDRAKS